MAPSRSHAVSSGASVADERAPTPGIVSFVSSPWIWGPLMTVGFYLGIPHLPYERSFAERYFCGHWIEYATTALFFLGMAILARKALVVRREQSSLALDPLAQVPEGEISVTECAAAVWRASAELPPRFQGTSLALRVREACRFVAGRGSAAGFEEHLKYLADLAIERLNHSYALLRTITWAIPILGFLGTVIGITEALAKLGSSLEEVLAGLAIAFDTTALSLSLSFLLVFATFALERVEQKILARIEKFGTDRLAPRFSVESAVPLSPWDQAQADAGRELVQRSEQLISWQTSLWQESLEGLRSRWTTSLDAQQAQLATALKEGVSLSLANHARELQEVRGEILSAASQVAHQLQTVARSIEETSAARQAEQQAQVAQLRDDLATLRGDQRTQAGQMVAAMNQAVVTWKTELSVATAALTGQLHALEQQGAAWQQLAADEHDLVRVQQVLTHNLEAVRAAETFEQTLHSLNAAVHLLTTRTRLHAA